MNGCESWTIKKAEHQRIDAFELWCWIRLLRILWTARRSNQSILKEINPEYSLEGLMLKLKLQYFGHLMWGIDSFKKTLMLGKIEDRRRRRQQRMRCLVGITDVMDMNLIWLHELVMACCSPWHCKGSDMTEPLNWTDQADNNRRLKFYKIMWRNIICHYSDLEYCFFITQLEKRKHNLKLDLQLNISAYAYFSTIQYSGLGKYAYILVTSEYLQKFVVFEYLLISCSIIYGIF